MSIKKQYLKSKPLCKVTFRIPEDIGKAAETAHVVGEFNDWDFFSTPMKKLKKGAFTVQVGAFKDKENADRLSDRLKVLFDYVDVEAGEDQANGRVYRVRVSKSEDLLEAGKMEKKLESMGFETAFIVSL